VTGGISGLERWLVTLGSFVRGNSLFGEVVSDFGEL